MPSSPRKWEKIRDVRRVVTGALEIARRDKVIGSSLEAAPKVFISDPATCWRRSTARISPRSASPRRSTVVAGEGPTDAFRLDEVKGVAVVLCPSRGRALRPLVEDHCPKSAAIPSIPDLAPATPGHARAAGAGLAA